MSTHSYSGVVASRLSLKGNSVGRDWGLGGARAWLQGEGGGHLLGSSFHLLGALLLWWRHLLVGWRIQAWATETSTSSLLAVVSYRQEM